MVVRRCERDWGSVDYDPDGMTADDLFVDNHLSLFDEDPLFELKLNFLKKCTKWTPSERPTSVPATTNFGPASIAEFFRNQIAKATTDGRLGNGKGKEPARDHDDGQYTEVGAKSQKQPASPVQDRKASPRKAGRLTLADDALLHLRGLASTQDNSATSGTREGLSFTKSPQPSSGNETPTRRRLRSSGRRSRNAHSRQSSQSSANATADISRRLDFAQHTESIRNRTRSRSLVEPANTNLAVSQYPELPLIEADSLLDPFGIEPADAVHVRYDTLLDGADGDTQLGDLCEREARSFDEERRLFDLTQASLSDPRGLEVPTEERPTDAVLNPNDLGSRLSLNTDDDDDDSDLDIFSDLETDRLSHIKNDSHSRYLKVALKAVAKPTNGLASGSSNFDYNVVVPSEMPRLVTQDHTPAKEDQKPVSKSVSPFTSPLRNRIRRVAHVDEAVALARERVRGPKRAPTKASGKFFIINDVFDRVWDARHPPSSPMAPPICAPHPSAPPRNSGDVSASRVLPFNYDVWADIVQYLSFDDILNLRNTCKGFAAEIAPIMLRSVVTQFRKSMFTTKPDQLDAKKDSSITNSILAKYGHEIHKFGISFEYDWMGLAYAAPKVTEKREQAWYGSYRWPVETYPRYSETQELEDLVDNNRPLLKDSIGLLTGVSELALCIDSGHGWLDGPDISDLELYEKRRMRGDKVFGQAFPVENIWHAFGRSELFKWGQLNSVNEALKFLSTKPDLAGYRRSIMEMKNMIVRDIEDFVDEKSQPDYDPHSHTGGFALPPPSQNQLPAPGQLPPGANMPMYINGMNGQAPNPVGLPIGLHAAAQNGRLRVNSNRNRHTRVISDGGLLAIPMQWPLIFSGFNLAGDVGGRNQWIQKNVPSPSQCPLIPGHLTEAQVQWLMETLWAQRVFLSSYTTAVITHKQKLSKVHTLTIAKISAGLLPSLAQKEFWSSLTGLKRLKVLVSPDWRNEHIPGDKFFAAHMPMSPVTAASKFADFLRTHIAKLENLSHLTIGYVGGGEHATGLFARNQHLLPAPITSDPRQWVSDHVKKPDQATIFAFNHIRDLTFENCWFSPCMLETFLEKSRDTSLHTLVLDSVSMLARQASGIDGSLQTIRHGLRCLHDENDWLHEEIPASATWTDVLDKITPGVTMLERKYASGMIDEEQEEMPPKEFRGNVQKIVLKSCGYAKISGVKGDELNQNALVVHSTPAIDVGLVARKRQFEKYYGPCAGDDDERDAAAHTGPGAVGRAMADMRARAAKDTQVMMSMNDAKGDEWFGLGTLTQCVHPVEKRILEQAWGMSFGWGNDLARWTAMEDGFFEGGTGRFSGVVGGKKSDGA